MTFCKNCNKETKNPVFCSLKCSSIHNNRIRTEKSKENIILYNCNQCGKETKNKQFCSRSCSAIFHNINKKKKRKCKRCNNFVSTKNGFYCNSCNKNIRDWSNITLEELRKRGTTNYHARLRALARINFDYKKCCSICGYSKHTEICHIKEINEFSMQTMISVVNALNNLIELCPNCHWELDHNLINIYT
jgi:hypothetical protein